MAVILWIKNEINLANNYTKDYNNYNEPNRIYYAHIFM